jgi:hypothetical protein
LPDRVISSAAASGRLIVALLEVMRFRAPAGPERRRCRSAAAEGKTKKQGAKIPVFEPGCCRILTQPGAAASDRGPATHAKCIPGGNARGLLATSFGRRAALRYDRQNQLLRRE